jgi:hypothetical protein
LKTFFQLTG